MARVFDPWIRLSLLEFCFNTIDHTTSQKNMNIVKQKLHKHYDEYFKNSYNSSRTQPMNSSNNSSISSFRSSSSSTKGKRMFNVTLAFDNYLFLIFHSFCTSNSPLLVYFIFSCLLCGIYK